MSFDDIVMPLRDGDLCKQSQEKTKHVRVVQQRLVDLCAQRIQRYNQWDYSACDYYIPHCLTGYPNYDSGKMTGFLIAFFRKHGYHVDQLGKDHILINWESKRNRSEAKHQAKKPEITFSDQDIHIPSMAPVKKSKKKTTGTHIILS